MSLLKVTDGLIHLPVVEIVVRVHIYSHVLNVNQIKSGEFHIESIRVHQRGMPVMTGTKTRF
jgi:hypothetical protein